MAESVYEETRGRGSKKVYALVAVIVILVGVIGFLLYATYGGFPWEGPITNEYQAANALSDIGNDVSDISEGLKDIEDIL